VVRSSGVLKNAEGLIRNDIPQKTVAKTVCRTFAYDGRDHAWTRLEDNLNISYDGHSASL